MLGYIIIYIIEYKFKVSETMHTDRYIFYNEK